MCRVSKMYTHFLNFNSGYSQRELDEGVKIIPVQHVIKKYMT